MLHKPKPNKAMIQDASMKIGKLRKLYSLHGTAEILEYIEKNPGCNRKDLKEVVPLRISSHRLATFREYGLIHQREELTLTELGKKYLSIIREMEALERNG